MIAYLDTNIAIYAVENPPIWGAKALAKLGDASTPVIEALVGQLDDDSAVVQANAAIALAALWWCTTGSSRTTSL